MCDCGSRYQEREHSTFMTFDSDVNANKNSNLFLTTYCILPTISTQKFDCKDFGGKAECPVLTFA